MAPASTPRGKKEKLPSAPSEEKYKLLKLRLKEILEDHDRMTAHLRKAKAKIHRLRREKELLLDRLERYEHVSSSENEENGSPGASSGDEEGSGSGGDDSSRDSDVSDEASGASEASGGYNNGPHSSKRRKYNDSRPFPYELPGMPLPIHEPPIRDIDAGIEEATRAAATGRPAPMFHGFDIPQIEVHAHHQHGAGSPIPRPATPSGASNNETVKKSRKAQHPPSRRVANIHKLRKVQHVPLDESGKPILPVTIGIITVHQLGTVVWDRKGYYNDRYIFPVGYTSTRSYASMIHLGQTTNYTCSVGEGPDGPRFYVTPADAPDRVAEGSTPTGAWTVIVKAVNALRGKEQTSTVSGPDYFGFSHPTISKLIQDLPDVDKCEGYIWQQFEEIRGRGTKRVRSGSAAPVLPSASPLATASVTSSPKRKVPTELLELPPDWGELGHSSGPSGYLEPAGYSRGQSPESDSMVSEEDESDDE